MLTTADLFRAFTGRLSAWGLGLGVLLGAVFLPVWWLGASLLEGETFTLEGVFFTFVIAIIYLPVSAGIGLGVGAVLGIVLGVLLALLTRLFFHPLRQEARYIRYMMGAAAFLTFVGAVPVFLLVGQIIQARFFTLGFAIIPSFIAACASAYAARRTAEWYARTVHEVA